MTPHVTAGATPVVAALAAAVVLVAGCSSSGSGPQTSSGAAVSPIGTSRTSSAATNPQARALATKVRTGLRGLTSAHIDVDAGTLGGTSTGDFSYAKGQSTASDITLNSGADKTEVRTVGATTYAKLPPGRNTSGKPWVKVSATSKNEFVRGLAGSLDITKAAASLPAVADVTATASSVQAKGGGRYALMVDPARSSGTTLGALLAGVGQKSVPVDLYLDSRGRPTRIVIAFALGTQTMRVTVTVTNFDAPLHITAPPPDQVAEG